MQIIAMRPGEHAKAEDLDDNLKAMQTFVDGYIESVMLATGHRNIVLWCNEEGLYTHARNRVLPGQFGPIVIHGPCFISAVDGAGETVGLTEAELEEWLAIATRWPRRDAQ